jgi:hypothetical protein
MNATLEGATISTSIEIGPTWDESGLHGSARDSSERRAHARRGHFRNQRVGLGRTERRLT